MPLKKFLPIFLVIAVCVSTLFFIFKFFFPVTLANISMKALGFVPYKPLEANIFTFRPDIRLKPNEKLAISREDEYIPNKNASVFVVFMNGSDSDYKNVSVRLLVDTQMKHAFSYHRHGGDPDFTPKGIETPKEVFYNLGPLKQGDLKIAEFTYIAKEPGTANIKAQVLADKKVTIETKSVRIKADLE